MSWQYKPLPDNWESERKKRFNFDLGEVKSPQEKFNVITRNLQEVLHGDKLRNILDERNVRMYWGTATTGAPHIGYFVPMSKIADFLRADSEVVILFADLHAYLDNMKAPWPLLAARTKYYEAVIKAMLKAVAVPIEKLKFIRGTDYQLTRRYTLDVYKLSSISTTAHASKAGAEVVKQVDNPLLSGLLYPLLQALDEEYLGVDAQFGGVDQRKIFTYAETFLPKIGYKKRIHLMNPMVPGLNADKMSSSEGSSKIDLLDAPEAVQKKVMDSFCEEGNIERNGCLSFVKMVLFPLCGGKFIVERPPKFGGDVVYKSYEEIETAFKEKQLFPLDLKHAVITYLNLLLQPIREEFSDAKMQEIRKQAYPSVEKKQGGISVAEVRVAKIVKVSIHPKEQQLYVAELDIGKDSTVKAVLGLVGKIKLEDHVGHLGVAVVNIAPYDRKGESVQSFLLGASDEKGNSVELLSAPDDATVGERITVEGFEVAENPTALNENKKKEFTKLKEKFSVNEEGTVLFDGQPIITLSQNSISVQNNKHTFIR